MKDLKNSVIKVMGEPLEGKTFVFTGVMSIERDEARKKVIMLGGRVTGSPSGITDYLVIGEEPGPSKISVAEKKGIKILNEKEFLELIEKNSHSLEDVVCIDKVDKKNNNIHTLLNKELWCEKYRPKNIDDLIGNKQAYIQIKSFLTKPSDKKAALISGQPGMGKTTMISLICLELGFKMVELNASDTRNKNELIKKVRGTINLHTIGKDGFTNKVLVMDEVDGMSSDRGGIAELISIIKLSKIPIICICNDRNHVKMRTLANYCLDVRFRKLDAKQILPRMRFILEEENKKIKDSILNEIIMTSNADLRYCINLLQNICCKNTISLTETSNLLKKTPTRNIFDLSTEIFHRIPISSKIDIFFEDYNFLPLFVYENILKVSQNNIKGLMSSYESISFGDVIDKKIHGSTQEWSLLPSYAFYSCINSTRNKNLNKRIDFPTFLGQRSKMLKNYRNVFTAALHSFEKLMCNVFELRIYYIDILFNKFCSLLNLGDIDGCINFIKTYELLKSDIDNLADIAHDGNDRMKQIATRNKSAFTRKYKQFKFKKSYLMEESKKIKKEIGSSESDED